MRACTKCGEAKPATDFFPKSAQCKPCRYEVMRAYRKANWARCYETRKKYRSENRQRMAELTRKSALKQRYGLTPDEYAAMLAMQCGLCAICGGSPTPGRRLCVDHCHKSGKPRALLCDRCNAGLGAFRDRPDLLVKAAEFIRAYLDVRP
jgi:hypothetical protein